MTSASVRRLQRALVALAVAVLVLAAMVVVLFVGRSTSRTYYNHQLRLFACNLVQYTPPHHDPESDQLRDQYACPKYKPRSVPSGYPGNAVSNGPADRDRRDPTRIRLSHAKAAPSRPRPSRTTPSTTAPRPTPAPSRTPHPTPTPHRTRPAPSKHPSSTPHPVTSLLCSVTSLLCPTETN